MKAPKDAKARKEAQRKRDRVLGIKRVEVRLSIREREQLDTLRAAKADLPALRLCAANGMRRRLQWTGRMLAHH